MAGWSFWTLILLVLFIIAVIKGLLESKDGNGRMRFPSSGFWFWTLVGLAVVLLYTPLKGLSP